MAKPIAGRIPTVRSSVSPYRLAFDGPLAGFSIQTSAVALPELAFRDYAFKPMSHAR